MNWLVSVWLGWSGVLWGTMLLSWPFGLSRPEDQSLMSMQPQPWPEPADDVAQAVQAMYAGRRAPLAVVVRDELDAVFADVEFAEAFAVRGQPGWSPGRLAMITVLQAAEDLTDVQAAAAVRLRLDWKYLLGLSLADRGLDDSVLSEFRTRVVDHGLEARVLDLLVARLVDKGLLKARGKQRTDSTHVLAAVRQLNQIELVGETVRACVEALAAAAPDWVAARLDVGWQRRYGARVDSWRMPASMTKRAALGADYARDGAALLRAVWDPSSPAWLAHLPAVEVLRRVLIQNVVVDVDRGGREVIRLREADTDGLPPGRCRIVSPYDTDARWGGKRDLTWNGYKLHISESCDAEPPTAAVDDVPDTPPNLITNVATTDWQTKYARRAGVEATIAQAVKVTNIRRARYRGLPKTRLEHNTMAAALNLIRLDAWWNGEFLDSRRTTHLSRLELAPAA